MTDQPAFMYRDTDGARLLVDAVNASTYYGNEPVVAVLTEHRDGDDVPVVYIPLDQVEEVVTGIRDAARQAAGRQPECLQCDDTGACNGGPCAHPAVGEQAATQPAEAHPADELKAAAFLLRNPMRGLSIGVDTDLSYPLADWLDHQAAMTEHLHNLVDGMPSSDGHPALAVARAINGTAP